MELSAGLRGSIEAKCDDGSFPPRHLQLQHPAGILVNAPVTHIHVQNVGPCAVGIDLALLVSQIHLVPAANTTKLQCCVAWDV